MKSADIIAFNPLDKRNLGASVAQALIAAEAMPLARMASFRGAGVYALYYHGDFAAYAKVALPIQSDSTRPMVPIYVGKAVPDGARKGAVVSNPLGSFAVSRRLREHAESIAAAQNLKLEDFSVRYLVVDDIWIPLGESLMIAKFSPLWNQLVDGFGNHDPGAGRHGGMRPRWDVLHPGRARALKCKDRPESAEDIEREVRNYLDSYVAPKSAQFMGTT